VEISPILALAACDEIEPNEATDPPE